MELREEHERMEKKKDDCDEINCPPFINPSFNTKWSIYHSGCISWDINAIDPSETTLSFYIQYGDSHSRELLISSNIDVQIGKFEWISYGILPDEEVRVKMIYNVSKQVRYSDNFEVTPPYTQNEYFC